MELRTGELGLVLVAEVQVSFWDEKNFLKDLAVTLRNAEKIFKISPRQRGCGLPIPGTVQGQAGWGSEQPDSV